MNILNYKDKYIHTDNDGDYYIEVSGDTIFIYFEESDSWSDWMSNFDFITTSYKNSEKPWKCHRGFFRVWKTMKDEIETKVATIIETCKTLNSINPVNTLAINKIICVGYSHGAALCGLCVEDMTYLFKNKYNLEIYGYGFGCPNFTQSMLPKDVKERFINFFPFRNGSDIVTYVPPAILGYGCGGKKFIKIKPTKYYNCFDAHRPESYEAELKNLCK
jgi:hypothetical protein